jgi:hypothetical protein
MANVSAFTGAMPVIPGGTVELGRASAPYLNQVIQSAVVGLTSVTCVCDGGTVVVEFDLTMHTRAADGHEFGVSVDGGAVTYYNGRTYLDQASGAFRSPVTGVVILTPSAGSRTFQVCARSWTGNSANSYIASNVSIRVSKIVNQNDGLKPFWTPPVVTQLPSQATEGDQVVLYSASPYAGYQPYQHISGSWRLLGDSRAGSWSTYTPTVTQSNNVSPLTVHSARYTQIGKTVIGNGWVQVASGGTGAAGSNVFVSLPVTSGQINGPIIGSGYVYDASTNISYICALAQGSTTSFTLQNDQGGGGSWGSGPYLGLAVNDQIRFSFTYEAA